MVSSFFPTGLTLYFMFIHTYILAESILLWQRLALVFILEFHDRSYSDNECVWVYSGAKYFKSVLKIFFFIIFSGSALSMNFLKVPCRFILFIYFSLSRLFVWKVVLQRARKRQRNGSSNGCNNWGCARPNPGVWTHLSLPRGPRRGPPECLGQLWLLFRHHSRKQDWKWSIRYQTGSLIFTFNIK